MIEGEIDFPKIEAARKTGGERFCLSGKQWPVSLLDFWQWPASDLVSNATRGVLAEYIVAHALGLASGVRAAWDAFDLLTPSGLRIEVKSAAYLQSWYHKKLSSIQFGIRPTRAWEAATNVQSKEMRRQADVYIFCVLHHKEKTSLDPLNIDQWEFYILPAVVLDEKCPGQKSIGLNSLLKLRPCLAKYDEVASCVERVAGR